MSTIFLSHNSNDKKFVRKLAAHLGKAGVGVWLDEAEIKIGDSLIEKISKAISEMDYLGVILSENSIKSEWVKREVRIALMEEISGKTVKVLPMLLENCEIPSFLKDKLYADFSAEENYVSSLQLLLDRLVPNEDINARLIVNNSILIDEAEKHRSAIILIINDPELAEEIGDDFEVIGYRLERIKEICNEVSDCKIYQELKKLLLQKLSEPNCPDTVFYVVINSLEHDDEVLQYIFDNFCDFRDETQGYFMSYFDELSPVKYLPLIKKLMQMNYKDRYETYKEIYNSMIERME